MSRAGLCKVRSLVALAAAGVLACALPSIATADAAHFGGHAGGGHFGGHAGGGHFGGHAGGGHFGGHAGGGHFGGHAGGGHFGGHAGGGGGHFVAHPSARGGVRWHGPGVARGGRHWYGGAADGYRWHAGFAGRGDRDRGHWRGGDWDDRYWTGALWGGGDWDGLYWPPVDYGWNYPWYLAAVPYGAVTIWFGDIPYYYVNQVYYVWSPSYDGYVVTDPPPVAGHAQSSPQVAGQSTRGVLSLRIIPRKGQSRQQTANDRYACHRWAVAQSGFNPISSAQDAHASSTVRADYRRALTACLNARGYSVK